MEKERLFDRFVVPLFIFSFFIFGLSFATEKKVQVAPSNNNLYVVFLNVGQGDAISLRKNNTFYLIDGGPDRSLLSELPKAHPVLTKRVDYVFLTHPHADHLAGLNYLFNSYEVNKVFTTGATHTAPDYREFKKLIEQKQISQEEALAGKIYLKDELRIEVLWPREKQELKNLNDTSMVLLVSYKQKRFLFLGDLSAGKQDIISDSYTLPDIDVIKIAHHGSKTGLSKKLLLETKPEYAIITVGENSYGHPAQSVLNELAPLKILRTDIHGTIFCHTDGKELFCKN